jgi:hypothetical protein
MSTSVAFVWFADIAPYLDEYLTENGEGEWLNNMAEMALPNSGDSGSFGCGSRDQPCFDDLPDCLEMAEAGFGGEFWIFNAIRKMQVWIKLTGTAYKMLT